VRGIVKLRDVLLLSHAKPSNAEQAALWKRLVENTLESPDTWEVALSAGKDKRETWERLLREEKLGGVAVLRNLRLMLASGVDPKPVSARASRTESLVRFRYVRNGGSLRAQTRGSDRNGRVINDGRTTTSIARYWMDSIEGKPWCQRQG
jgi:hypothetical protein